MRENRLYGSEGGEVKSLPYPYQGAAVRPSGLLAPRMLGPLDCFVARAPRNDGWVAADPIDSVVIGRRLCVTSRVGARLPRSIAFGAWVGDPRRRQWPPW